MAVQEQTTARNAKAARTVKAIVRNVPLERIEWLVAGMILGPPFIGTKPYEKGSAPPSGIGIANARLPADAVIRADQLLLQAPRV